LPDEDILQLLRNWNAGLPLFQTVYASVSEENKAPPRGPGEDEEQ
jgi:hypothetical protein